jgi:uroporphyrinogen decarboxylase
MNRKERFLATIERRKVDRPARWLGMPTGDALPGLFEYFGVATMEELKRRLGDDVWPIDVPYDCPPTNHIACAFDFAREGDTNYEHRTLTTPGYFQGMTDPVEVQRFAWPNPADHIDLARCREVAAAVPDDYAKMGVLWSAHFQDACAAFGMESALVTMLETPDMFRAVIDRITEFYFAANKIVLDATEGMLDAVLLGNDFGSQTGLMVRPEHLREFVFPGMRRLVDQAHRYGVKVIYHSCGSIHDLVEDLIEIGVDAIHPIQAAARNMDAERMAADFGGRVSFVGGVDAQRLLVLGTPDDIRRDVARLEHLFPTGLVISPSHEAILPDIPPENVEALFQRGVAGRPHFWKGGATMSKDRKEA